MTFEVNQITIKIKKGRLTISEGLVISDKICSFPISVIPNIKWAKDIELLVMECLLAEKEFDTLIAMKTKKKPASS